MAKDLPRARRWNRERGVRHARLRRWLLVTNATTVALTFLLIVLVVAATSRLWVAVTVSVAAMLSFNFFFLPPVGTLTIADPQNWVALFVFLAVSLVASNLSSMARARTSEAIARRDEMGRLFDLSRDVLLITDSREALSGLARAVARRFELEYVAICLPRADGWDISEGGALKLPLDPDQLTRVFAGIRPLEYEADARVFSAVHEVRVDGRVVTTTPLRLGAKAIGLLATAGRLPEAGALDALGGVVAIAIERAQFLEERKTAELARQSEELKSALLASLGHDLRTPLTAIRVAASNLQASWLTEADRREQSDLVIAEVGRLTRLFQNILEMARIDAGAIATDARWVHPSEIVEAARDLVREHLVAPPRRGRRAGQRRSSGSIRGSRRRRSRICSRTPRSTRRTSRPSTSRLRSRRPGSKSPSATEGRGLRRPICRTCSIGSTAACRRVAGHQGPAWDCRSHAACWRSNTDASGRKTVRMAARGLRLRFRRRRSRSMSTISHDAIRPHSSRRR